jgi:triacylglycerol lipase
MQNQLRTAMLFAALLFIASCAKDKDDNNGNNGDACKQLHPVIFLHGFLASGDTWANQVMRFTANGYCDNLLYAYDWNTLSGSSDVNALNAFIDTVLARTGATQVDLVGHSAGGGYGYSFCEDSLRARKIAHYVHIGSSSQTSPAGVNDEVPTLCISSAGDAVAGATTITGATNVALDNKDHYQVATSAETFDQLYRFFNSGKAPQTTAITPDGTTVTISGRAVTLGENTPIANGTVRIFTLNAATGTRANSTPDITLSTNTDGYWGPVNISNNKFYEFEITSNISGDRIIHYYREKFIHKNPLVYLRTLPPASSLAGQLLSGLPSNDNQSVLAVFTANQATVAGRDTLSVNNVGLSTQDITPASATVIAMFLYDDNNNQQTDLTKPFMFSFLSQFLTARDQYFTTTPEGSIPLYFNGRALAVPNLKSASDGVIVAVFD